MKKREARDEFTTTPCDRRSAIKGLIIDAGGVLIRSDPPTARHAWERAGQHPSSYLDRTVREAVGTDGTDGSGSRSESAIRAELALLTGTAPEDIDSLLAVLSEQETVDPDVAELVRGYRPHCRTAVLSNAGPRRRADLVERFAVDRLVDIIVIAGEEGIAKPDARAYELTAQRLGLQPEECVFVDDCAVNVAGAARVGMTAVQYVNPESLAQVLREHITAC